MTHNVDRGREALNRVQDVKTPFGAGLVSDKNRTLSSYRGFGSRLRVEVGMIVDSVPYANSYWVQYVGAVAPGPAVMGGASGFSGAGARDIGCIPPGNRVVVLRDISSQFIPAIILAVIPPFQTDGRLSRSDYLHQGSRSGLNVDSAHSAWTDLTMGGLVTDFSAGRPVDETTVGERGWITETGMKIHISPFMAQIAANEAVGLQVFYPDGKVRLSGFNLEVNSNGMQSVAYDDEGEIYGFTGWSPYLWETLGFPSVSDTRSRTFTAEQTQGTQPERAAVEPKSDDQQSFFRTRQWQGYVGQGGRYEVVLPKTAPAGGYTYGQTDPWLAVASQTYGLEGAVSIFGAQGFFAIKGPPKPAARPKKRPEDPTGDNPSNYKAAGLFGSGTTHNFKPGLEIPDATGDDKAMIPVSDIADRLAVLQNWEHLAAFVYHKNDFDTPEESGLDITVPKVPFDQLKSKQLLPLPTPVKIRVDDRTGEVDYYPNSSHLALPAEGTVSIGAGWGETFQMVGGDLIISAPGRIFLKAGKDIVQLAGHDIVQRAKNSIDLSATNKDVRIYAGNNMQIRAGSEGNDAASDSGGILIESRSKDSTLDFDEGPGEDAKHTGIILKSVKSKVVTYGQDILLRSGSSPGSNGGGGATGFTTPGHIVLDAGNFDGNVEIRGGTVSSYATVRHGLYFLGEGKTKTTKVWVFDDQGAVIDGSLKTKGGLTVEKEGIFGSGLTVVSGAISTRSGVDSLAKIPPSSLSDLQKTIKAVSDTIKERVDNQNSLLRTFQKDWYGTNKPSNDELIAKAIFSFRVTKDYKTEGFLMYEDRWQQMARQQGQTLEKWKESSVTANAKKTYPFPGDEAFTKDSLCILDPKYTDNDKRVAKDRGTNGSNYQDAKYPTPEKKSLNDYVVIL